MTFLQTLYHVLFTVGPKNPSIAWQMLSGIIYHRIRKTKKDRTFRWKGHTLYYPAGIFGAGALEQIFVDEYYKPLRKCHHVLDMGGFFGESAVYLGHYCESVDVYEPEPHLYTYVQKNTSSLPTITAHNKAVVASHNQVLYFDNAGGYSMCGHVTDQQTGIQVQGEHIEHILAHKHYNGIKMDIEGAEFEVIERMNKHYDRSTCQCGFIEFHFFTEDQRNKLPILEDFLSLISQTHQHISFHGHHSKPLHLTSAQLIHHLKNQKASLVLVYFAGLRKSANSQTK